MCSSFVPFEPSLSDAVSELHTAVLFSLSSFCFLFSSLAACFLSSFTYNILSLITREMGNEFSLLPSNWLWVHVYVKISFKTCDTDLATCLLSSLILSLCWFCCKHLPSLRFTAVFYFRFSTVISSLFPLALVLIFVASCSNLSHSSELSLPCVIVLLVFFFSSWSYYPAEVLHSSV